MSVRDELYGKLSELQKGMLGTKPNLSKCQSLLVSLKIGLTSLAGLQPNAPLNESTLQDVVLARSVYETAALLSIKQGDMETFERHISQAKTIYLDYAEHVEQSPKQSLMLGLNLMRLLAQNRIAEFHTELELIPRSQRSREDEVTSYVLRLEQYLMEGSYAKLQEEVKTRPDSNFDFFIAKLMETVRKEIADCTEKAYRHMECQVLARVLDLSLSDCLKFSEERGWKIDGSVVKFTEESRGKTIEDVPSIVLIKRTLDYAKELEQIV